jgi:hypothetical protein
MREPERLRARWRSRGGGAQSACYRMGSPRPSQSWSKRKWQLPPTREHRRATHPVRVRVASTGGRYGAAAWAQSVRGALRGGRGRVQARWEEARGSPYRASRRVLTLAPPPRRSNAGRIYIYSSQHILHILVFSRARNDPLYQGVPSGKTIGPRTSARLSFPHRCSTSVSANGKAVPGPRLCGR